MQSDPLPKQNETRMDILSVPIHASCKTGIGSRGLVHYHDAYELCLFEHASARVFLKNNWYDVHDGDVVFVPRNIIHRYSFHEIERYTRLVISFKLEFVMKILHPLGCEALLSFYDSLEYCRVTLLPSQFRQALSLGNHLLAASGSMNESRESQAAALSSLYLLLHTLKPFFQDSQRASALPRENQSVRRVINYIDEMYASDIRLDDVAGMAHIDKYHLCHLFKRHVGMTLVKYMQFRRIIEAQKMMLYSEAPIDTIASRCGFNNIQHFYKVFKEFTGSTPLQYRRQKRLPG